MTDAEKALSDAMGFYRQTYYQATDRIAIESEIRRFGYTANGDYIVIMDDSDIISCIDGKNGNELWSIQSTEPYEYVEIHIVDEQQAVLLTGKKGSKLVTLVTGEILWEVVYEEIVNTNISNASISDASLLLKNEQLMVQEIVIYDNLGSCIYLQYLVFDIKTGILKSKTENLLEEEIYRTYVSQNRISMIQKSYGEIEENHVCAVTLEVSLSANRDIWLLWFDLESGKLLERSIFQIDSEDVGYKFNEEKDWIYGYYKEVYSPEGELLGDFFCIRDRTKNRTIYVEFFPEEKEALYFSYQEIYAFEDEKHAVFVYGNAIYGLGYGESISYISYEKEIVRCIETDEHTLYLLFSDGSTQYFDIEEFHKGDIRLNNNLTGRNIEIVQEWGLEGSIYSENEEVFYVRSTDTGELIRCAPTEDKNNRHIDVDIGLFRESTTYVTLNRDVLFSMSWDYVMNVYQAALIDVEKGCAFENYTLDQVLYGDECFGISVDQKLLLFQDFLYDWSSGAKIPLDQISIEQLEDRKIQLFDELLFFDENRILRREECDESYMPDKLYWLMNGKVHEVSMLSDGANVLEQKAAYKKYTDGEFREAPYVSEEDFIAGKCGVFLFLCSDEDSNEYGYSKVTHYMAYSLETETWSRVEDISTNKNDWDRPIAAVGDVEKWIVMADTDNMIRLYDLETDTYIQEWDPGIHFSDIRSLTFIMEDQYLKVRTNDHIMIIDVQSGAMVYEQYQDYCYTESDYWWNDQKKELFLYSRSGTGYCIDTDSWTEKYEIDHLVFASDQAIVTNNYSYQYDENSYHDVVIIYPYYSLAQKIQLAKERFDLSDMPQGQVP